MIDVEVSARTKSVSVERDQQIDLVKTVAIFLVILVHVCFYTDPVGSSQWTQALILGSLARPSVPLFLMASGALLLRPEKDLSLKRLLLHNLPRLLAAMVFWGMIYKVWEMFSRGITLSGLWEALKQVLTFQQEFHLYYIHITILVYLFLPVTRVFVRSAKKHDLEYALAFWFGFGVLYPMILPFWPFSLISGFPLQWAINMTYTSVGYGLLGWYLRKYPFSLRVSLLLLAVGYSFVFCATYRFSLRFNVLYELFLGGMSVGPCLMSAGLFCLLSRCNPSPGAGRVLSFISEGSFCVYLVHVLFLYRAQSLGYTSAALPRLILIPLVCVILFLISMAVYWLLSKIPVINHFLI